MSVDPIDDASRTRPQSYLRRADDDSAFAFVRGHDVVLCRDDTLWAHLSEELLLSVRTGERLAYQVGTVFYNTATHEPIYYLGT